MSNSQASQDWLDRYTAAQREQAALVREADEAWEALLDELRRDRPDLSESELRDALERDCLETLP